MKKFVIIGAVAFMPVCVRAAEPLKIAGTPVEIVISEVTGQTARVEIVPLDAAGKAVAEPASTVMVPFPVVEKLRLRELEGAKDLQAGTVGGMKVVLKNHPITLSFFRPAEIGQGAKPERLLQEITIKDSDGSLIFDTAAPTFGLGEGRQQFDRRGFYYNFQNGQNQFLQTNGGTVPVPFLIGSDGWGMFIHNPPPANAPRPNTAWGQFDLRGADAGPPPPAPTNQNYDQLLRPPAVLPTMGRFIPRQDVLNKAPTQIYMMNLDQPADALKEYIHLTGSPAMPPKWVMGYIQSHRSLTGPDEPLAIARKFREDKLPCDALIYLGSGYTNDQNGLSGWNMGHGSLTFNPRIFPNPQETIDQLHALNFKIILHKNAAPAGLFGASVNEASNDRNHISNYWNTHVPLMKMGIDAWWPDDGDELPIENRLARIRLYYDGPLKDRPNERPWSLDRNGYAGVARYDGWVWSGDVTSRWATLAAHVADGLQFSLSESPWWGTDTGGFVSSREYTGELYTRWFEFSAFCPMFRSHGRNWQLHTPFGWNTGDPGPIESVAPDPAELHNAAVEPICKKYLELRYQLLPYNYTIMREASDTGMPPMRALMLEYPNDPVAVSLGDEYLWGPDILVAPVVEKGATKRHLYLPEGDWYDFWTNELIHGGKWIDRAVDLGTMPLYVRAGTVLPMDPVRQYTGEAVTEPTTLVVYPGDYGTFTMYDDDGHTQAYKDAGDPAAQWINFQWHEVGLVAIEPDPRMKKWPGGVRVFNVKRAGSDAAPQRVEFRGLPVDVKMP